MKHRRDRRWGLPVESRLRFYPRYWCETVVKMTKYLRFFLRTEATLRAVMKAPDRHAYTDIAITPLQEEEFEQLGLFHATSGGEAALAVHHRRIAIRSSGPTAA